MNMQKAKKLSTAKEFELIELASSKSEQSPKRLKSLISRTRKLRNKYRDLAKRQTRKSVAGAGTPERTADKASLFQQTLEQFEKKAGQGAKASQTKTSKSKSTRAKGAAASSARSKKSSAKSSQARAKSDETPNFDAPKAPPPRLGAKGLPVASNPTAVARTEYSENTRAMRNAKLVARAATPRIQGHQSSQTKRNQKSRDVKNAK